MASISAMLVRTKYDSMEVGADFPYAKEENLPHLKGLDEVAMIALEDAVAVGNVVKSISFHSILVMSVGPYNPLFYCPETSKNESRIPCVRCCILTLIDWPDSSFSYYHKQTHTDSQWRMSKQPKAFAAIFRCG